MIGDDVEVTILSTDGAKVRLGIQAPSNVPVHRTEIYLEIKSQGDRSTKSQGDQSTVTEQAIHRSRRRRAR